MLSRRDNPPKTYPFVPGSDKRATRGVLDLRVVVAGSPDSSVPSDGSPLLAGNRIWLAHAMASGSVVDYVFRTRTDDGKSVESRSVTVSVPRGSGIGRFSTATPKGFRVDMVADSSDLCPSSMDLPDYVNAVEPGCVAWLQGALRSLTFMNSPTREESDAEIVKSFQGPDDMAFGSEDGYGFSYGEGSLDMSVPTPVARRGSGPGFDGLLSLGGAPPDGNGDIRLLAEDPVTITSPGPGRMLITREPEAGVPAPDENPNPIWRVERVNRIKQPDESGYSWYSCVKVPKIKVDAPDKVKNRILCIPIIFGTDKGAAQEYDGPWVYNMVRDQKWPPPTTYVHACEGYHNYNVLVPDYPFPPRRLTEFNENAMPVCFDVKRRCDGPESDYCGYWKVKTRDPVTREVLEEEWVPLRETRPWDKSSEMVPSSVLKKARYDIPDWFDGHVLFVYCPPRELHVCFDTFTNDVGDTYLGYYDQNGDKVMERKFTASNLEPKKVHSSYCQLSRYLPKFTRVCPPVGGDEPDPAPNGYYINFHSCAKQAPKETFPVRITGRSGAFYTVDLYEDGYGLPSTGSGCMFVMGLNLVDNIRPGVWTIGMRSAIAVTGGGSV